MCSKLEVGLTERASGGGYQGIGTSSGGVSIKGVGGGESISCVGGGLRGQ